MRWIRRIGKTVIRGEGKKAKGTLSVVLLDDKSMKQLNRRFLKRNRTTDVLAFPLENQNENLWGEIYISKERVREQALEYGVSIKEETARLVVHGILHLLGYKDCNKYSMKKMRDREDHYLKILKILSSKN